MKEEEKHILMMTILIEHEYYGSSTIPVKLIPDKETEYYLKKYNIICRQKQNQLYLYGREKCIIYFKEKEIMRFLLQPTHSSFLYVTILNQTESVNCLLKPEKDVFKSQLDISVDAQEVILKFKSPLKYFEYILFPYGKNKNKICLRSDDIRNNIAFEDMTIQLWQDKEVVQFKSCNKILLTKFNTYSFNLIEQSDFGERILIRNISSPDCRSLSLDEPYDTITSYHLL